MVIQNYSNYQDAAKNATDDEHNVQIVVAFAVWKPEKQWQVTLLSQTDFSFKKYKQYLEI